MNDINKAKVYRTKNITKNNYNFYQEKIPLDNINHNINNIISVPENESIEEKKKFFLLKNNAQSQKKIKLFKKGKDNRIFITNRNNSPIITFNKGIKNNSQFNIFTTPIFNLQNNNSNTLNNLNALKVQKSGESNIKNSKNIHILNSIYQNNTFNFLNNSHSLNNYHELNNRIQDNNNQTPKKADILEYIPLTSRKIPEDNIIFNNVRVNNKSNIKRYSLFNSAKDNKRTISNFKDKVINRKDNKKDNLTEIKYDSAKKIKNNHIMNKPQTQTKNLNNTNYLINQINNININFNNNENNKQANNSSIESIINQIKIIMD